MPIELERFLLRFRRQSALEYMRIQPVDCHVPLEGVEHRRHRLERIHGDIPKAGSSKQREQPDVGSYIEHTIPGLQGNTVLEVDPVYKDLFINQLRFTCILLEYR